MNRDGVEDTRLETNANDTKKVRGQGQDPRTQAHVFSKKKFSKFFFRRSQKIKKVLAKFLTFSNEILTIQEIELSSAEDRAIFKNLRLRGQGQGLHNMFSRIPISSYEQDWQNIAEC